MSIKEELVTLLEANGELAGENLARMLGVSRQAVWKAVKALNDEGYEIAGTQNKGYKMIKSGDALNAETIKSLLNSNCEDAPIVLLECVDSTNTYAKKLAADGAISGTAVITDEQTAGRGRRGHSFFSPSKTGLYMSVILRKNESFVDVTAFTVCAANAVCMAVEKLSGKKPKIKWVNDIFLGKKKICGILTEATTDFESGGIDSVVVGIGVNIGTERFPDDVKRIAGSVGVPIKRNALAAEIINNLYSCLMLSKTENMMFYREHSLVVGKDITFTYNNKDYEAKVLDINEDGELIVLTPRNVEMVLNSGEISIKI